MKIIYFEDTDTLLVNFNDNEIVETRDVNENLIIEFDKNGKVVSLTIEHAKELKETRNLTYNQVPATPA
jgi:uncharacterized protein YuzE